MTLSAIFVFAFSLVIGGDKPQSRVAVNAQWAYEDSIRFADEDLRESPTMAVIPCMLQAEEPVATAVDQAREAYEQSLRDTDAERLKTVKDAHSVYVKQLQTAKDVYLKELRGDLDEALESKDLKLANDIDATIKSITESSVPPDSKSPLTVAAKDAYSSATKEAALKQRQRDEAARTVFEDRLKGLIDAAMVSKDLPEANRLNEMLATLNDRMPDGLQFVQIPSGEFEMGSPGQEMGRGRDESPHRVRITRPFEMSIHEITQEQFEFVMGTNPSHFKGPNHPVDQVTWEEAVKFCDTLSQISRRQGSEYGFRLPTEAEWEYACRAGSTTMFHFGDDPSRLGDYAWFLDNSGETTHPVGQKNPNAWGLYDMHGNVFEWCQDFYFERAVASVDPQGPRKGVDRILRGGAWYNAPRFQRSANRGQKGPQHRDHGYGFRVVRGPNNDPAGSIARSFLVPVPALGAVTAGSFTAFTVPAHPRARESFHVVIEIQLPKGVSEFPILDLSGEMRAADGYSHKIPYDRRNPYAASTIAMRVLDKTTKLQIESQRVQFMIKAPGTKPLIPHVIRIRSELLNEEQELVLIPTPAAEK